MNFAKKIHIEERHWKIVKDILNKYPYTFYAFGSRVKGKQRRFSDLDIYSPDSIPLNIQGQIEEDFEMSDLPFTVDVVSRYRMTPEFQEIIKKDLTLIQRPPHHAD
jgi:predicted nucleotidyltransferase